MPTIITYMVLDKQYFFAVFYFSVNSFLKYVMLMPTVIICGIQIASSTVFVGMIIGKLRAEKYLYFLNRRKE